MVPELKLLEGRWGAAPSTHTKFQLRYHSGKPRTRPPKVRNRLLPLADALFGSTTLFRTGGHHSVLWSTSALSQGTSCRLDRVRPAAADAGIRRGGIVCRS